MKLFDKFAQFRIFSEDVSADADFFGDPFKTRISLYNGLDEIAAEIFSGSNIQDMADSLCRRRGWYTLDYLKSAGCMVTLENGRDYELISWFSDSPLYFRRICQGCRYLQQFLSVPASWMK